MENEKELVPPTGVAEPVSATEPMQVAAVTTGVEDASQTQEAGAMTAAPSAEENLSVSAEAPVQGSPVGAVEAAPAGVVPTVGAAGANGSELPDELRGWNWGAFLLTWIWAIAHKTWIGLLSLVGGLIPFVGPVIVLVMWIMLGLKGNEWAWKNRKFASVEEFKEVQKKWAIWGLVLFIISIVLTAVFFSMIMALLGSAALSEGIQ